MGSGQVVVSKNHGQMLCTNDGAVMSQMKPGEHGPRNDRKGVDGQKSRDDMDHKV